MKRFKGIYLLGLLALVLNTSGFGQESSYVYPNLLHYDHKPYNFGFSLGLNKMNFSLQSSDDFTLLDYELQDRHVFDTLYSVLPRPEYGFNIGIISNLKLGKQWDLRLIPTLTFGDRNIEYIGVRNNETVRKNQKIESTLIDIPLHVKYKSVRMGNARVYVIGGVKYSYDLASAEDQEDYEYQILAKIKKNDFFYELGAGMDYYFYYFKFAIEIKASFGLREMLDRDNTIFSNSIEQLRSQIVMVSFLFE